MTKSEMIDRIAQKQSQIVERDIELTVKMMLDQMAGCLACGGRIEIRGFGSFTLRLRPARVARNPVTGTAVSLLARHVPYFKPAKKLWWRGYPCGVTITCPRGAENMEPVMTIGLGAIAAYLGKDGIAKLLGPTADYLGGGLRDLAQRRVESIGKIFSNASKKLGSQLDAPGEVPPRILRTVMNEASFCEDPVALEYFGGVLASSRTDDGRDDRGARVIKIVDNLSAYQIRTHYLLYSTLASLLSGSGKQFSTTQDRARLELFLPFQGYATSMGFSQKELNNPQILDHIWHGLSSDDLIEGRWEFGTQASIKSIFPNAPGDGIVCCPSALGAELFLWAFGYGDSPLERIFAGVLDTEIEGLPSTVSGAVPTKST